MTKPFAELLQKFDRMFRELSGGYFYTTYTHVVLPQLLRYQDAEKPDGWKEAIIEACIVNYLSWDENNPQKTLADLIGWECTVALDPRVSEQAAKLLAKSPWVKVSDRVPDTDRSVFTWCEGLGIHYNSHWNPEMKSFNLAWLPTHWMERPEEPQD